MEQAAKSSHHACIVPGCVQHQQLKVHLHVVPDPSGERGRKWLKFAFPSGHGQLPQKMYMCKAHFDPECYYLKGTERALKSDSVPTLNGPAQEDPAMLRRQITALQAELAVEQSRNEELKRAAVLTDARRREIAHDLLSSTFTRNQVDRLISAKANVTWNGTELGQGMALSYFSQPGYRYLVNELKLPYPRPSTLRKAAARLDMREGFFNQVFELLADKAASLSPFQKEIVIMFDECYLREAYEYDLRRDQVMGLKKRAQVIMIRGLFAAWKQPIYVEFDQDITRELLFEAIHRCHQAGYNVAAVVSDCGGANLGLCNQLTAPEQEITWFTNPADKQRKVFWFADAPHLIKLLRNHLFDNGFILENGTVLTKEPLQKLLNRPKAELDEVFYLKKIHLECKKVKRQNVSLATQICSRRTAQALRNKVASKEAHDLADFLDIVNNWFDVCNSRRADKKQPMKSAFGKNLRQQVEAIDKMVTTVRGMREKNTNKFLPFQKMIVASATSLKLLFRCMIVRYGANYLLTTKLNQDALENLFSIIRTRGGGNMEPSPLQFLQRLRIVILGKFANTVVEGQVTRDMTEDEGFVTTGANVQVVEGFNRNHLLYTPVPGEPEMYVCDDGGDSYVTAEALKISEHETPEPEPVIAEEPELELDYEEIMARPETCFFNDENGFNYALGAVARKFPREQKLGSKNAEDPNAYVATISDGGLTAPSTWFKAQAELMEDFFQKYNGAAIQLIPGVIRRVSATLAPWHPEVPLDVIKAYIRLRIHARIKLLNYLEEEKKPKYGGESRDPLVRKQRHYIAGQRIDDLHNLMFPEDQPDVV